MKTLLVLVCLIFLLNSCNNGLQEQSLSGSWYLDYEGRQCAIDGGNIWIPCNVVLYNYDNNFIIAAQRPSDKCFLGRDSNFYKYGKYGVYQTYYWIIVHKQKLFLGPLDSMEFKEARIKYKVPESLILKPVE